MPVTAETVIATAEFLFPFEKILQSFTIGLMRPPNGTFSLNDWTIPSDHDNSQSTEATEFEISDDRTKWLTVAYGLPWCHFQRDSRYRRKHFPN